MNEQSIMNHFISIGFLIMIFDQFGVDADSAIFQPEAVKISELVVPEVVQAGNTSSTVLQCRYYVADNNFTVHWLFNRSRQPIFEWNSVIQKSVVGEYFNGRLDIPYMMSNSKVKLSVLRIIDLSPELTGEYSCKIKSAKGNAEQTKTMVVYSPERDIELEVKWLQNEDVAIKCHARGLYPQPELTIERNGVLLPKQELRVWRSDGQLFDSESTANLPPSEDLRAEITCRLSLPQAGYVAMKKELLQDFRHKNDACFSRSTIARITVCFLYLYPLILSFIST